MNNKINEKLTEYQKKFFNGLSIHIDEPIYFYGSINRNDYSPGKSDIDIDIFTDNETSTIYMLCNYLNLNKKEFKNSVYKIDSKMVYGYKGKYQDNKNNINVEISIYNNKYKEIVLRDQDSTNILPLYVTIILFIVKFFYYNLGIMPNNIYRKCKQYLMNKGGELKFILVD